MNQNTAAVEWFTPDQIPPESEEPCFGTESIPVLGYTKFGSMKVVYWRRWRKEGEEYKSERWYTGGLEGWDITDELTAWTFLPKAPK